MTTKTDFVSQGWERAFDDIGFGNQARIVGTKRVELKDFIRQLLSQSYQSGYQDALKRMEEEVVERINDNNFEELDVLNELLQELTALQK